MATIKISELSTAGSFLFTDSETFLNELEDAEIRNVQGGSTPACAFSIIVSIVAISYGLQGYNAGRNARYARR